MILILEKAEGDQVVFVMWQKTSHVVFVDQLHLACVLCDSLIVGYLSDS